MESKIDEILTAIRITALILVIFSSFIAWVDQDFSVPYILNTIALIFYVVVERLKN